MPNLDNLKNAWDEYPVGAFEGLSAKIFSETVCSQCESNITPITDNMGREIFWEDLGRPN